MTGWGGPNLGEPGRNARRRGRGLGLRRLVLPLLFVAALPVLADPVAGYGHFGSGQATSGQSGSGLASSAQPAPPREAAPPRLVFNLSSGLTYDDNPDLKNPASGAGTRLDTRLGLVLNQSTRISSFTLSLDGLLRAGSGGTGSGGTGANANGFREPAVKLGYKADTGNTKVTVDLADQQSPVDVFKPVTLPDGSLSATDLAAATGTVTHQQAGFTVKTGVERPLGFDLSGNYDARLYSDANATTIYDSHVRSGQAALHWRLDGVSTVSLTANASATDYANTAATRQRSQDVSLGYDRLLRPDLTLQVSLGNSTASATSGGVTTKRSAGFTGSLGLVQKQAGGQASVTLASSRDALGPRTTLSFGRSLALPTGSFNATAGVSTRKGAAGQLVGSLAYTQVLPTDTLGLNLSRQIGLDASNNDQASTVVEMNWQHKVNAVSSLGLSLSVAATSGAGGAGVASTSRQTLGATWSHDLAQDWQLSAGYQHRVLDQQSAASITSNSVFMTISRKLTLLQ